MPIVLGGGVEYERDSEEHHFDIPLLFEYHFSDELQITIEPNFVHIESRLVPRECGRRRCHHIDGIEDIPLALGDTETSVEWEFLPERRWRPALTAEAVIRWPTATKGTGDSGIDVTEGLILSKDFVFMDVDFNAAYTFSGSKMRPDTFEISLAVEVPITHTLSIEGEIVHALGAGGVRGQPGTIGGFGTGSGNSESELTLALAWQASHHLKLEGGMTGKSDRTWQAVFAFEYSIAGDY